MTSLVVLFSYQINRISRKEITPQQLYERSYIMKRNNLQQLYERSSTSPLVYVATKSREIANGSSSFSCEKDFERQAVFFERWYKNYK